MNERINGLWWKARIGYNNQSCDPEVLEKFAELIVAECLGIVDDAERGGSNDIWDNAVKFIRQDLQEHFGVAE